MYVSIPFVHISLSNPARDVLLLSSKVTPLFPLYIQDTPTGLSRLSKIINFSVQPLSIFQQCKILPPQPVFSWQKQFIVTSGSQCHMQSQDSILFIWQYFVHLFPADTHNVQHMGRTTHRLLILWEGEQEQYTGRAGRSRPHDEEEFSLWARCPLAST